MNISMVGKKVELTDSIKEYIENALESLKKYNLDIISIAAVASLDEKKGKKGVEIDFTINLAHKGTVVIKQKDKDLYAAIDVAIDRAQKVLRRHHDKVTDHKKTGMEENTRSVLNESSSVDDAEVIPMELDLYKPMEIDEALERLNDSSENYYVFNDHDGNMRVITKVSSQKFGLY